MDHLPPVLDRVLISLNPKAGRRSPRPKSEELAELLLNKGFAAEICTDLDHLSDLAARWHQEGTLRAVVAVGGDGTAAEIVNRTPPGVPLAVLPHGTENLLAKYLTVESSAQGVAEMIIRGAFVRLDAGRAVSIDPHDSPGTASKERLFLLMASAGLDADVVHRLEQTRRGHISHLSYVKPIVQAIRKYQYPELRIGFPGEATEAPPLAARWMFLFNLPCYARGLKFTPEARGDDGLFDLCTFARGSFWQGLRYLTAVLRQRQAGLSDCTMQQVTRLRVEADQPVPYQLDGDFGGFLPLEIEVVPERLTLIVPPMWSGNSVTRSTSAVSADKGPGETPGLPPVTTE